MPTYEYECTACGHKFEEWQSITADPITKCPECKKKKVKRLLGTGGAIIFKGSGYYQTDYRSESYKKAEKADSASSSSDSKSNESKSSSSADGAGSASSSPAPAEKKTESKPKKNDSKS
jgi:putative FmdB family regulatory protein